MMLELPPENLYIIRDPKNFLADIRDDVKLLHENRRYLSLTTVIMCCLDALASGSGDSEKGKFEKYVTKHFPDACAALESAASEAPPEFRNKSGAMIMYEGYRNGFAHSRAPNMHFAIADDGDFKGWADWVKIGERRGIALNVDRLAREFLTLLDQSESPNRT